MKVVVMSDTHGKHRLLDDIPEGDMLIHCGDMTKHGKLSEAEDFAEWFGQLEHEHKVVIAGNHDFCFDDHRKEIAVNELEKRGVTYLENESEVVGDVKVYGSPNSNSFDSYVFTDSKNYREIPDDIDILVTHGPPKGELDKTEMSGRIGDKKLKEESERVQPELHAFGHVHENFGKQGHYLNASVLNEHYRIKNQPRKVDVNVG